MLALGDDDSLELLSLLLGAEVSSDALLQKLEGTLILGDTEHFQNTLLVGGESGDLTDDFADNLKDESLTQVNKS